MNFDSNKRPVRLNGTEEVPVRWLFKGYFIEVVWSERFYVQARPIGEDYNPLSSYALIWPVSNYRDRKDVVYHINRLLIAACASVEQNKFLPCRHGESYTKDGIILSFLQSVKHRKFPVGITENEVGVLKTAKQLAFL